MSREIKFRAWDEKYKQFADYEDIEECLSCQNRDGWRSSDGMGCCFGINAVEILADCILGAVEAVIGNIHENPELLGGEE